MASSGSSLAARSSSLAALTVLLYDNVLQFGDEVQLVWGFEWSFGSVLYIASHWSVVAALILNTISLLLARIYALYNGNKPLLLTLILLYLVEFVTIIAFIYEQGHNTWRVYKEDKPGRLLGVILRDCPTTNPQWGLPWLCVIPALIANRLFLNTRREYYRRRLNLSSVHLTDALGTR
ncbi:hypothetical protein Clacol_008501 [Clathrus columnatus]|uniref:DUF6533 domain-containing protein n=1 Tax=Clathrus columnatus TaxID=1419009 RepID=A0AAV5AL82_9AGAM|nr:hypothetical protein Clacol_008501 [Clathrus columnatus]